MFLFLFWLKARSIVGAYCVAGLSLIALGALVAVSMIAGDGPMSCYGHYLKFYVPQTFEHFRGMVDSMFECFEPMQRNVIIVTSTRIEKYYDVRVTRIYDHEELSEYSNTKVAHRRFTNLGLFTMVQILYCLWPLLESGECIWEEAYIFPNEYTDGVGVTMVIRHSAFPTEWVQRYVKSVPVDVEFMDCFWYIEAPPIFHKRVGGLNMTNYTPCRLYSASGPTDFLWPSCAAGVEAYDVLAALVRSSHGSSIKVPLTFLAELDLHYCGWVPRLIYSSYAGSMRWFL